jgi:hypothetical protein
MTCGAGLAEHLRYESATRLRNAAGYRHAMQLRGPSIQGLEKMNDWAARPLDEIYAAIFIDAIVVKVRDGQVANRPFYAAIGVSLDGDRDILGLWAGSGGEGAKVPG